MLDKWQLRDVPWLPVLDDSWREYSRPVFKLEAFKAAVRSAMEMAAEDPPFDDIAADVTYDEVFREGLRELAFPRIATT